MNEAMPAREAARHLIAAAHALIAARSREAASMAIDLALAADPDSAAAHTAKAHVLEGEGAFPTALIHWRTAARLDPDSPACRFNLAIALLGAGQYREGFALHEARLDRADWIGLAAAGSFAGLRHRVPRPGDVLAGRRVLVFTEQGLGDMVWAARFPPDLARRGVAFDLACPAPLRPLLSQLAAGEVLGPPADRPDTKLNLAALVGRYDAFVPMMSLPWILNVSGPAGFESWLAPAPAKVAAWRARYEAALPGRRPIVGVVWRANPASASAAARSFSPMILAGLASAGLVNLQGGAPAGRDALAHAAPHAFDPLAAGEVALDEYAAMIAATDLTISADTLAAHLCGAMGHPGWIAVPTAPNFYWGQSGAECPWYPSLRLFRAAGEDGWPGVGEAMARALAAGENAVFRSGRA